jgi:hypothetical protein
MEGMIRGFSFKDFLEKNVYAIKYGNTYSLITSIDHARKVAMRSGLAGKSAPIYDFSEDGKTIISCSVTVKRNADGVIGEYTSMVFFSEFSTGRNLWSSKPRVMIAKVAEMHALRSAFPEEMAKAYIEEEMEKETVASEPVAVVILNIDSVKEKLNGCKTLAELTTVWTTKLSADERKAPGVAELKDSLKSTLK